ncbi:unnamed protein product [Rotaria sp. Silwood2]|nr:unnamed protein product [Rotaria sp. Silwood2]
MSVVEILSQGTHYIHQIIPAIKIYYKLNNLLKNMLTTHNNEQDLIVVTAEYNNQKRYFLSLTFDELLKLLHFLEPSHRTLYEVLCQNTPLLKSLY